MKRTQAVLGAVSALLGLPLALVLVEAAAFHVQNRTNGTIVSSGEQRDYLLYVPRRYDRAKPTPLVISMHGAGGWPVQQRDLTGWNRVAEKEGFIVVYPAGLEGRGPRIWRMDGGAALAKDVRFLSELIDRLGASYNIDPTRIYADGLSNGGGMAFVLSCTLSDRIAAVGMVGAAQLLPWEWCPDQRPVPMITFHGTADRLARYHGGRSWVTSETLPDIPTWTARWAARNRCGDDPVASEVAADVTRLEYRNCADDADVVLYTVEGGGHTWPGGQPMPEWFVGPTTRSIDATSLMWAYFRAHPLRKR